MQRLQNHSKTVQESIQTTLGKTLQLPRVKLVEATVHALTNSKIVLISGTAGSGKSVLARKVIDFLSGDSICISFRAEEFAVSHIDEALLRNQMQSTSEQLRNILESQQDKKIVFHLESVERILESSTRDAFTDLLMMCRDVENWHILMTCRDYSTFLIQSALLNSARIPHSIIDVYPLSDDELEYVKGAFPFLERPLKNARLRLLLSNPYTLDQALRIDWSSDLPQSERDFRNFYWDQVVLAPRPLVNGMAQRRSTAFINIALQRAKALSPYTTRQGIESDVVEGLRKDGLIVESSSNSSLVAPAHDVLEDWALLRWLDDLFAANEGDLAYLVDGVGPYPALRRTYRGWVSALVDLEPNVADEVFEWVAESVDITLSFRDDTLTALLRSPNAPNLLKRNQQRLFSEDFSLLKRIIYLTRIACVAPPKWLNHFSDFGSLIVIPDGPSWAAIAEVISGNIDKFERFSHELLVAFIEDWIRLVPFNGPHPDGEEFVGAIAFWLLERVGGYGRNNLLERVLKVIAHIPCSDNDRFISILTAKPDYRSRGWEVRNKLRTMVLRESFGGYVARELPDVIIAAAKDDFLLTKEEVDRWDPWRHSSLIEPLFGIRDSAYGHFMPASAYQGFFIALLRSHFWKAIHFILYMCNYSADWYQNPPNRLRQGRLEPAFELDLEFDDGSSKRQIANGRLWRLYRGTSVGPNVLQSMLMALELRLLDGAKHTGDKLDDLLIWLMKNTDSVAVTAVVASVATAFPHLSSKSLLVLLKSKHCIRLDRERFGAENQAPSTYSGMIPSTTDNKIYDQERQKADARKHRKEDLEHAIFTLQFGEKKDQIQEILDAYRGDLPPEDEQNTEDRLWRISLNRMDLRKYKIGEPVLAGSSSEKSSGANVADTQTVVPLIPVEPAPDLKPMVNKSSQDMAMMSQVLGNLMWGQKMFEKSNDSQFSLAEWRSRLAVVQDKNYLKKNVLGGSLGSGGPGYIAAVCVRECWDDLDSESIEWCVKRVCSEVLESENWAYNERQQEKIMSGDAPSASVIPLLSTKNLGDELNGLVRSALPVAITHSNGIVRWYAVNGVRRDFSIENLEVVIGFVNLLATETIQVQASYDHYRSSERAFVPTGFDEIHKTVTTSVRDRFLNGAILVDAFHLLNPSSDFGGQAFARCLSMLLSCSESEQAREAFQRLTLVLVQWWAEDDTRERKGRSPIHSYSDYRNFRGLLKKFVFIASFDASIAVLEPILEASERFPKEVGEVLLEFVIEADTNPQAEQFWLIWDQFAARLMKTTWLPTLDREHPFGSELVSNIFLGRWWKEDVRHWKHLTGGYSSKIEDLFKSMPTSPIIFDYFIRYLYKVGENSIPRGYVLITEKLKGTEWRALLDSSDTIFMLEVVLQRDVYGRPHFLKRKKRVRLSVLYLLDVLVELGSSAAFRMRDDFVTPIPQD